MKVEVGSFTPNSSSVTVLLNDSTMNIKGIHFQIGKASGVAEYSSGFTDGVTNRAAFVLTNSAIRDSRRSTTNCIIHYDYISGTVTNIMAGHIATNGLGTAGQFTLDFSTFSNAYTIDYMAYGD